MSRESHTTSASVTGHVSRESRLPRLIAAGVAAMLAVAVPIVLALAAGGEAGNPLNLALEGVSSTSSGFVREMRAVLPIGFAFAAGMASSLNPCGFFLLPAYLGLYVQEGAPQHVRERAVRGLTVAITLAVSFVVLFGIVGVAVGLTANVVIGLFPVIALGVGVALILAGAYRTAAGSFYSAAGQRLAARLAPGTGGGLRRYFLFGLAYGAASLSCTLPVFLAVVGSALTSGGILGSARDFALYGLGMASVVAGLTLALALFQGATFGPIRRLGRIVDPLGTVLLYAAGSYVLFYWLTLGGLLAARPG